MCSHGHIQHAVAFDITLTTAPNTPAAAGGLAFTVVTSLKVHPPAVPLHPDRIAQVGLVVLPVIDAVVAHHGCAVLAHDALGLMEVACRGAIPLPLLPACKDEGIRARDGVGSCRPCLRRTCLAVDGVINDHLESLCSIVT